MIKEHRDGWIEVVTGVMFSGKSEELLRRVRRAMIARKNVQVFKSHLDDRYGGIGHISSHDGQEIPACPVSSSRDEVHFLDGGMVAVVNALADEGRRVIIAGTDMDFRGEPFGPVPALLAVAERIDKLHAICVVCGELATRNQRLIDGRPAPAEGPTIQVGGLESYEARCRRCHEVPSAADDQMQLISQIRRPV
jgi:thymidine kinase